MRQSWKFCVLSYQTQAPVADFAGTGRPIAVVFFDGHKALQLLVSRDYRDWIIAEHAVYLEELFRDFVDRGFTDPVDLFLQVSSLNVGPLVTAAIGEGISLHRQWMTATMKFVPPDTLRG